jgi:hypothetical protein
MDIGDDKNLQEVDRYEFEQVFRRTSVRIVNLRPRLASKMLEDEDII